MPNQTMRNHTMRWAILVVSVVVLAVASCGGSHSTARDDSAQFFTTGSSAEPTSSSSQSQSSIARAVAPPAGDVARPNLTLTPGAVAESALHVVCASGYAAAHTHVAHALQVAAFGRYHLPFPPTAHSYGLDFLIPVEIGGAPVITNIWPMAESGLGFHQKQQLNRRLRDIVCQGQLPLHAAQRQVAADWYALWFTYVPR